MGLDNKIVRAGRSALGKAQQTTSKVTAYGDKVEGEDDQSKSEPTQGGGDDKGSTRA